MPCWFHLAICSCVAESQSLLNDIVKRGGQREKDDGVAIGWPWQRKLRERWWPMWVKIHTAHNGNNSSAPQTHHQKQASLSPSPLSFFPSFYVLTGLSERQCHPLFRKLTTRSLKDEPSGLGVSHVAVRSFGTTAPSCLCHASVTNGCTKEKLHKTQFSLFFLPENDI